MNLRIQNHKNHEGVQYYECEFVNIDNEDQQLINSWQNWLETLEGVNPTFVEFTSPFIINHLGTENWAYEPVTNEWPRTFYVREANEPFRVIFRNHD